MVGCAKSETKKRQIAREMLDAFKQTAVAAYCAELAKPIGIRRKGARTVAKDFVHLYQKETGQDIAIDHNFLIQQAKGWQTRSEANAAKCLLKPSEIQVVIDFVVECGNRGFPLSHKRLKEHVDKILQARLGVNFLVGGVGKKWTHRFVENYLERLKATWATPLESKRGRAVNKHTVNAWFDLYDNISTKYQVKPENTYGTDEFGTNTQDGEQERVIGGNKSGPQYQQRDGTRKNITVIVTICADGTSAPPAVIFKGQAFQAKWKQDNPANAS